MKNKFKYVLAGICIGLLLSNGIVFGKQIEETIHVAYNNIKIVVKGNAYIPKDANGDVIEPFLYEGTAYVPIRTIAEALDKNVIWNEKTNTITISDNTAEKADKLPAIKIAGNDIAVSDDTESAKIKKLFTQYISQNNQKNSFGKDYVIKEILAEDFWAINKMKLYNIYDYNPYGDGTHYGVMAISDGKILGVLYGMPIESVYIADINNDGKFEVCANVFIGSGIIDYRIVVLDTQNAKKYDMNRREESENLFLDIDEETKDLIVHKSAYRDFKSENKVLLGRLMLIDGELVIEE